METPIEIGIRYQAAGFFEKWFLHMPGGPYHAGIPDEAIVLRSLCDAHEQEQDHDGHATERADVHCRRT